MLACMYVHTRYGRLHLVLERSVNSYKRRPFAQRTCLEGDAPVEADEYADGSFFLPLSLVFLLFLASIIYVGDSTK